MPRTRTRRGRSAVGGVGRDIGIDGDVVVATLQVDGDVIAAFLPTRATPAVDIPPASEPSDLRSAMPTLERGALVVPRMPTGVLLFASAQDEPRARRPTDMALADRQLVLVVVVVDRVDHRRQPRRGARRPPGRRFPGFFDPMWRVLFWTPVVWALVLLVAPLVRRRRGLPGTCWRGVAARCSSPWSWARSTHDDPWSVLTAVRRPRRPAGVPARGAHASRRR